MNILTLEKLDDVLIKTDADRPLYLRFAAGGETAFPDDDFDAGLLWSIEQIKQTNRDLLAGLEALTIPDDATFEEAQAIIAEAVAVKPWMPEEAGMGEFSSRT